MTELSDCYEREQLVAIEERAARFLAKTGNLCLDCLNPKGQIPIYNEGSDMIVDWRPCPTCRGGEWGGDDG